MFFLAVCLDDPLHSQYSDRRFFESPFFWGSIGEEDHSCLHSSHAPTHDKDGHSRRLSLSSLIFSHAVRTPFCGIKLMENGGLNIW